MGEWSLPGPDIHLMSKAEVCSYVRLSEATLDRLISDGRFPRGHKPTPGSPAMWQAQDIAAWLAIAQKMVPDENLKKSENSSRGSGTPGEDSGTPGEPS